MSYALYSRILNWESGVVGACPDRRFETLKAARKAFRKSVAVRKQEARVETGKVKKIIRLGCLVFPGGFSARTLLFRTCKKVTDLDAKTLKRLLVASDCFDFDYATGRSKPTQKSTLEKLAAEELEPTLWARDESRRANPGYSLTCGSPSRRNCVRQSLAPPAAPASSAKACWRPLSTLRTLLVSVPHLEKFVYAA